MSSNLASKDQRSNKPPCNSLSSYLCQTLGTLTDGKVAVEQKIEAASSLEPFVGDDDAYISFSGEAHQAHLPALTNWNGNSGLRKGYTLLMWVRPRLKESSNEAGESLGIDTMKDELQEQRVFYRFSTSMDDSGGTGVCVVCSQWKAVPLEENGTIDPDKTPTIRTKKRQLETILTAYTLPRLKPHQIPFGSIPPRTHYVQQPLILAEDEWHLLGFSHTHPYLKAATWSVTVNGRLMGSDNLPYPVIPENHHVTSMEYCSLFQNITSSGAILTDLTGMHHRPDYEKTASQLQAEAASDRSESSIANSYYRKLDVIMDMAAMSLYADKTIPLPCLAVAAEAGPTLALQKAGRVLPTLPPVANWTKGASLEGPKVGIPLAVHSSALALQQLSSAPNLVFCCSAVSARVLGSPDLHSTRLVCTMQLQPASTFDTPRVGLVQPAAPLRISEDELPCLYVVGNVRLYHGASQLLLNAPENVAEHLLSNLEHTTKHLSVALLEQEMLSSFVRPFFLALCPPGRVFEMHLDLYVESLNHLYSLYSNEAIYAAKLIHLFATGVKSGGGRLHEEVLQSGLIHVLASSLRLSLQRAVKLKLFQDPVPLNSADFVRKVQKQFPDETSIAASQHSSGTSPPFIPDAVITACCEVIDVCCGPSQTFVENLSPHYQIRRTSDLALTAIFGLALDFDLWTGYPKAASSILECVTRRYGGVCVTSGYVIRSQISVQHYLDIITLRFDDSIYSQEAPASQYLQESSKFLSMILQAMLLSSLTNMRSISQGEHDIAACVNALTQSTLGTITAHVVLNALVGILAWCDVLPIETATTIPVGTTSEFVHEQEKTKIASRLGRNVLVSQFHDIVAPMILSRTVFSGDRSSKGDFKEPNGIDGGTREDICWQNHWRLSLLLFSWLASIAGPEGVTSTKSCGRLLLASSRAGSLEGVLEKSDKTFVSTLFLPSPTISLFIGSNLRNEWSYSDLLSDRLEIMIPLLPAITMALLSHIPKSFRSTSTSFSGEVTPTDSLKVLSDILTAVGGAFHRVFGGIIHLSSDGHTGYVRKKSSAVSSDIKAAKAHVPNLVLVSLVLEDYVVLRTNQEEQSSSCSPFLRFRFSDDEPEKKDQVESWMDVSLTGSEALLKEIAVTLPTEDTINNENLVRFLHSCMNTIVNTTAGLLANAMDLGGSGAAVPLWENVITCIQNYASCSGKPQSVDLQCPKTDCDSEVKDGKVEESLAEVTTVRDHKFTRVSRNVLCLLISKVIFKALKRTTQCDTWSYELCSSIARVCSLVEDTSVLSSGNESSNNRLSNEQIELICIIIELLSFGRDSTGWCQIILPSVPLEAEQGILSNESLTSTSKLFLPILRPCLRIILGCTEEISSSLSVLSPNENINRQEQLLNLIVAELNLSLTAAIVGQTFSSARNTALLAMSILRKAIKLHENRRDEVAIGLCRSLFVKVAEELRVRYENERRLRENTLEAYDGTDDVAVKKNAAEGSQLIESLIVGTEIFKSSLSSDVDGKDASNFLRSRSGESDYSEDFVMFHNPKSFSENEVEGDGKLGFEFLQGLCAALEAWKNSSGQVAYEDDAAELLSAVSPFIDAWDDVTIQDTKTGFENVVEPGFSSTVTVADTAADIMSTFFEFAAIEKNRLKEISARFLPTYRYSRMAFAERFCWARHSENATNIHMFFERGTADGNRDIRSRIPTVPCLPQFRRYLPKYLDNGAAMPSPSELHQEEGQPLATVAPAALEDFTKSLIATGRLAIVDITKKIIEEEEEAELQVEEGDESELRERAPSTEQPDDMETLFSDSEGRTAQSNANQEADSKDPISKVDKDESDHPEIEYSGSGETTTNDDEGGGFPADLVGKGLHNITTSSFSTPPDNASSSLSLLHSAAKGLIEQHVENCVHVKAEGNRNCTLLLTSSHLILEFDGNPDGFYEGEILAHQEEADRLRMMDDGGQAKEGDREDVFHQKLERRHREQAALRPKSIRWNLTEVSHIYMRRYRLRDTALEIFFIPTGSTSFGGYGIFSPSSSLYLDFGPGYEGVTRRDEAAFAIMRRAPSQAIKQWPDRSEQFLHDQLNRLTIGWVEGRISNFDYLLHLNILSGRSYNDICQYPVFPWVLSNYTSEEIPDLTDISNFRDLSKPIGALNEERLKDFLDRFHTFADPSIPPFMYGSHYSTSAGVVLHFLVRLHPYAGLHRQLQGGYFDVADRLFSSVPRTWSMCTGSSAGEVKELTPEWYCNPTFLKNVNKFKLGSSQDGEIVDDVVLPPWAKGSPDKFVEVMRAALESDICSNMLSSWIDLIFGRKQQGPAAIEANNVFFYLTYYGTVDVASIEDESLRQATELQIAHFGQCPMQLFRRNHIRRLRKDHHYLSLFQVFSTFSQRHDPSKASTRNIVSGNSIEKVADHTRMHSIFGEPLFLPFFSAPISHWVHLDAPPPGPHAPMVAVRFAGVDTFLAIDAKGVFHSFRWAWRSDELQTDNTLRTNVFFDKGCFIAQRELPRFRSLPRLMYSPKNDDAVVAISKTLFAGRTILIVLSDGDGCGSLGMQLVDPAKGEIRGEVLVPLVHSARITCITTDPIGTAAGQGGVGGELGLAGSADGTASLWRFMSSHYLPLRPRVKLRGHNGNKIHAVALCSSLHIAVTISTERCCIHSIGNGALIRTFGPPADTLDINHNGDMNLCTRFAESQAVAVSIQGFIVTVCETKISTESGSDRIILTLHLFSVEGVSLGSKPLESWRGVPHKMHCSPDGTAAMVCCGRGVTIHRLSACQPLEFLDEFQITETDDYGNEKGLPAAWDIDFGPTLNRPVVAAAACSHGVIRLHALPGISAWSERHRSTSITQGFGNVIGKPARRLNQVVLGGLGFGKQIAGLGRDLTQEVSSDVKEKGVSGFLGNMFRRNTSK